MQADEKEENIPEMTKLEDSNLSDQQPAIKNLQAVHQDQRSKSVVSQMTVSNLAMPSTSSLGSKKSLKAIEKKVRKSKGENWPKSKLQQLAILHNRLEVPEKIVKKFDKLSTDLTANIKIIQDQVENNQLVKYQTYNARWILLINTMILIAASEQSRFTFSPIVYKSSEYLETSEKEVQLLFIYYMIAGFPIGLLTSWLIDEYGIRIVLLMSGGTNTLGSIIRALSTISSNSTSTRYYLIIIGHLISSCSVSVSLIPTKVAADWFPENERALANTLAQS